MEDNNSKLTWQQEEALEREKDRIKLFRGNEYCEGADEDDIYATEDFFRKVYVGIQIFVGLLFIGGMQSNFGWALVVCLGLLYGAKRFCRWAARKLVSFLKK